MWLLRKLSSAIGIGTRAFFTLVGIAGVTYAVADYNATQGAGTAFGSVIQTSVHYSKQVLCDFVAPATICATVKAANTVTSTDVGLVVAVANTLAPGQAAMASSSPVVIASNQTANALWGHGVTGAAVPANATYFGFNSGGNLTGPSSAAPLPVRPGDGTRNAIVDPCQANLQSYAPISITTATTTRIVAPSASNKTYICSLFLTSAAADNIGIVEGTGGTCGTGTAGVVGGTTAANGPNFAANGGVMMQAGGKVAVAQTAGTNVDLCLITSAATPLAGGIKYVQAP